MPVLNWMHIPHSQKCPDPKKYQLFKDLWDLGVDSDCRADYEMQINAVKPPPICKVVGLRFVYIVDIECWESWSGDNVTFSTYIIISFSL